jgi:hypothetical protein
MKYYQIDNGSIDGTRNTEKATAVITGWNQKVTNPKYYYEFVADSQIKTIDNNLYVPAWLARKISSAIDWNNSIEIEEEKKQSKPRKTKEEKEIERYNLLLRNSFNDGIPNEYLEYWFESDTSIDGTRFTTINKLENRLAKDDIIKINIVRNGQKEIIRG